MISTQVNAAPDLADRAEMKAAPADSSEVGGGAAVLVLEQRPPDGALATAWDAVAVLNALRFLTFAGRFYLRGPLLASDEADAEAPEEVK